MSKVHGFVPGFILVTGLFSSVHAQEQKSTPWIMETYPETFLTVIKRRDEEFGVAYMGVTMKAIMDELMAWSSASMPLAVCFKDGNLRARKKVVRAASAWEVPGSSIKFDFGSKIAPQDCATGTFQIRITFAGLGVSSAVGIESKRDLPNYQASMVLGGFDTSPPSDLVFDRWVFHEFGHALGFVHEHQGTQVDCEQEFDFPKLYVELKKEPYFWREEKVDKNMRQLILKQPVTNGFDPESIMLYTFDSKFYLAGTNSPCFHEENFHLSSGDIQFAVERFPIPEPGAKMFALSERQSLEQLLAQKIQKSSMSSDLKRRAIGNIPTLNPAGYLSTNLE